MSDIDDAIRQALSADDKRALDDFAGEQPLLTHVLGAMGGPFRWLNLVGGVGGVILFAGGAYAAWRFAQAPDPRQMLLWGGVVVLAWSGLGMTKLWFWMEMHRNVTVREIKRLELQVARLAARLPG